MGEYEPDLVPGQTLRTDIKPLEITQPDGPSFEVDGNVVRWQNWEFRLAFNYREGPVIHQVKYDDHGTVRDIAYRMSFAEMIVPVPGSQLRPLPAHRLRHRRVGHRLHDPVARAGLRLPG